MSALANRKYELFALAIVKGMSASSAYIEAGYRANDGNATRLNGNERIRARVAELLDRAAQRVEITVASTTEALLRIADAAEKLKDAPGLSVARAAHMDAAKLNGLVIEKSKVESEVRVISDQPLTAEEWAQQHVPPVLQ